MNKRRLLMVVGLAAFLALVLANTRKLGQFVTYLGQARWYVLIGVVIIQLVGYYCTARFYQSFLALVDRPLDLKRLYRMSLGINFVNQAFPSGGVSALSYMTKELGEVPNGKVTLAHFVRYLFTYLSFVVILLAGFLILLLTGNLSTFTTRLTLLVVLAILVLSGAALLIISERTRVAAVMHSVSGALNRFGRVVLRRKRDFITPTQQEHFITEFAEGYATLAAEHGQWLKPLAFLFGTNCAEVATVYIVCVAFGAWLNPGVVIASYTLANIASVAGVVTGGVGVFEATMIASFAALSVPLALATAIVFVYRILNFGIFLPLGFYAYRQSIKHL